MLSFFDWELKSFLGEEEWVFPSNLEASILRQRIRQGLSHDNAKRLSVDTTISLEGNDGRLNVYSNKRLYVTILTLNNYYFSGRIYEDTSGSGLSGEYRANNWRRLTALFVSNFLIIIFLISWVIIIFYLLYITFDRGTSDGLFVSLEGFILPLGVTFVMGISYGFYRLMTLLDKIGRNDIRNYLEMLTQTDDLLARK